MEIAGYRYGLLALTGSAQAKSVLGLEVSDRMFALLGVEPEIGRTFAAGEDRRRAARTVVLSHALWQRRYHADPAVVGRSVSIDDVVHTIVGVMPATFRFPTAVPGGFGTVEAWIPLRPSSETLQGSWQPQLLGRGTAASRRNTRPGARAAMATIGVRLARQYPETNRDFAVAVEPLKEHVAGTARPALLLLLGTVGFVLLLTCVNIANLLLVRSEARRREMAMRQALGASPDGSSARC